MPRFRPMTPEENRERQYELTRIRYLREFDPPRAEELWQIYKKEYFLIPPGPREKKADEAEASISKKRRRRSKL